MFTKIRIFLYTITTYLFLTCTFAGKTFHLFTQANTAVQNTFLFVGLFLGYTYFFKVKDRLEEQKSKLFIILSLLTSGIFSIVSLLAKYYQAKLSIDLANMLLGNKILIFNLLITFIGGCILFYSVIVALGLLRQYNHKVQLLSKVENFLFDRHSALKVCLCLILCWIPHLIVRYPGTVSTDTWIDLAQYWGQREYTTMHPISYTIVVGKLMDLGLYFGNNNTALFFLVLLQTFLTLGVVVYSISIMRKLNISKFLCMITLAFFAISPVIGGYLTTIIKDTPFAAFFLLLFTELVVYLFKREEYKKSLKHWLLTFVSILGTFIRYNGIYIVGVLLVIVVIREIGIVIKNHKEIKWLPVVIFAFFLPILCGKIGTSKLNDIYQPKQVSTKAMFAIPIQQIGRYMSYHGDDISDEELKTLQKVLRWKPEEYKKHYNPMNFDNLKVKFNDNATAGELKDFLVLWVKLFFRHPDSYFGATINQNYILFAPTIDKQTYYSKYVVLQKRSEYDFTGFVDEVEALRKPYNDLREYYFDFGKFPILGLFNNIALYNLLLFALTVYALVNRKGKMLLLSIPLWIVLAIAVAGPAIFGHPRYVYPILYSMPLFLGLFWYPQSREDVIVDSVEMQEP